MDWNLLDRVASPEDIVRLHDVDGLEMIVEEIIRGDFSSISFLGDDGGDYDDRKKALLKEKAFCLAQLLVEYLLFVQDVLIERKTASQSENEKLKTELEVWVKRAKEEREKRKELQTQMVSISETNAKEKRKVKNEKGEDEGGEELKGKLKEATEALGRAREELEELKRQQKAASRDESGSEIRKSGNDNSLSADGMKNNGSNNSDGGGGNKTKYFGKLTQEVKNLLMRVGAKSGGKLSDRNTARSFQKLKEIIESESNSGDRSAAERRKYQETSRNLHLTLVNGESFQTI